MNITQLNQEHPDYRANRAVWKRYQDLYEGGERIRSHASEYLVRRHKEPNDIYFERLSRVFYQNYIGSIVDWYAATLMRSAPVLQFDGPDERGRNFFGGFVTDCDLRGTSLPEFFKARLAEAIVAGRSYIVVDFPRIEQPAATRAEEDAAGISRAFLTQYTRQEAINWGYDDKERLQWILFRTSSFQQESPTAPGSTSVTRWVYYDRERYQIFEQDPRQKNSEHLVAEGSHGFAAQKRVPVYELRVTDGLWLLNKAALLQLEHFNKANALAWALTMGLFAMPVIYSDREWNQAVGDSYFIQLGPEDKFGWTEPAGNVFQIAADNLVQLKDEIYRVCYLNSQLSGRSESRAAQSALAKQWDFSVTQDMLRAYGDVVKEVMRQVLTGVAGARQDGLQIDVSGLNEFDIKDFGSDLDDAQKLLALGIVSPTLKKQLFKRIALKYFADARQEIKNTIAQEIEESLTE